MNVVSEDEDDDAQKDGNDYVARDVLVFVAEALVEVAAASSRDDVVLNATADEDDVSDDYVQKKMTHVFDLVLNILGVGLGTTTEIMITDRIWKLLPFLVMMKRELMSTLFLSLLLSLKELEHLMHKELEINPILEAKYLKHLLRKEGHHHHLEDEGNHKTRREEVNDDGDVFLFQ